MLSTRRTTAVALPALLLLALTACSPGGSADDPAGSGTGTGTGGGDSSGDSSTACIADKTWVLDIDNAAAQIGAQLASGGMNVTESTGEGRQSFTFDSAGTASSSVDVTYTITVDSGDGMVITVVQTHAGESGGEWAWLGDSSTITFANWDNGDFSVQNTVLIDGVAADFPIEIPNDTLAGTDMETDCSGSSLSTHVVSTPFTQQWSVSG